MLPTRIAAIAALFLALSVFPANAIITCDKQGCSDWEGFKNSQGDQTTLNRGNRTKSRRITSGDGFIRFLPHPPGCPRRAFCACGAAVEVFGKPIRSLWPSVAWFKFHRTSAAPRMVAVRRGHVFVLVSHVEGNNWLVNDYNSGGHLSRQHIRSIAGYTIVNPHGSLALN